MMAFDVASEEAPAGFEWDPAKARRNDAIRGRPTFRDATTAFVGINRREAIDERNSTDSEVRWRLVGLTAGGQLVTVAFTYCDNRIRVISARPATGPEIKNYEADHAKARFHPDDGLNPELDAENAEFNFSNAPRPGRNELFERAQGTIPRSHGCRRPSQIGGSATSDTFALTGRVRGLGSRTR